MLNSITRFIEDEDGATAIEYGIIAGLIAMAIVVATTGLGTKLSGLFDYIAGKVTAPPVGS
ncbi:pilus assembly protein Flp/PilA [Variovorax boronicumulans]|uniref:Flp family type IVb pilin n=1 Tax=Variovorax boronicumulans TaxID=436515 RepID=UPI002789031B|nr:Flp family type IVb pilin [Variovorax boronicumulans]MDP9990574.1 pilus assembly protein Flp/PilA [Variovorax boronicumulans]MDQ0000915.1 pilus assembly protein Flp/PilA [Variovorax boronicumulans]